MAIVVLTVASHAPLAFAASLADQTPAATRPSSGASAPTAVSARVTFDGSTCTYTGPTVIPFPATLKVEYAPTPAQDSSWIGILAIDPTATQADLEDPSLPDVGAGVPWFAFVDTHVFSQGAGTFDYRAVPSGGNPMADMLLDGRPYAMFMVMCLPTVPGQPAGGYTILHLVGPEGAAPSAAPASLVP